MNKYVICDANFLVALIDRFDKWHEKANIIHSYLKSNKFEVVYFDCVANEVISVLGKRFQEKGRSNEFKDVLEKFKIYIPKNKLTWIYPDVKSHYNEIIDLMEKTQGKLNFHDALISIAGRELEIEYIVSFDKDFDEIKWISRIKDDEYFKK